MSVTITCPNCSAQLDAETQPEPGQTLQCPACDHEWTVPLTAKLRKKSQVAGSGCLVQVLAIGIGFAGLITLPTIIGPVILLPTALILMIVGSRMAIIYRCSNCGNPVADRKVKICPTCGAQFTR